MGFPEGSHYWRDARCAQPAARKLRLRPAHGSVLGEPALRAACWLPGSWLLLFCRVFGSINQAGVSWIFALEFREANSTSKGEKVEIKSLG